MQAPRSVSIIVRAEPPGKISGGIALPKTLTLAELIANPELLAEFPEIEAALQELLQRFRHISEALKSSATLFRPAIPQITLSPLLLDLIAAAERDRDAIARLAQQREALRQIDPDLLIDVIVWSTRKTPSRPGRPVASYRFPNKDTLLRWLAPHVNAVLADGRYPSLSAVAGQMGEPENTIRHHFKRFYKDWESVLTNFVRGN
jgi:hypothetical protein